MSDAKRFTFYRYIRSSDGEFDSKMIEEHGGAYVFASEYDALQARVAKLEAALALASIRLGICADRMRACNEEPQQHQLVHEVDNWAKDAAARAAVNQGSAT